MGDHGDGYTTARQRSDAMRACWVGGKSIGEIADKFACTVYDVMPVLAADEVRPLRKLDESAMVRVFPEPHE